MLTKLDIKTLVANSLYSFYDTLKIKFASKDDLHTHDNKDILDNITKSYQMDFTSNGGLSVTIDGTTKTFSENGQASSNITYDSEQNALVIEASSSSGITYDSANNALVFP